MLPGYTILIFFKAKGKITVNRELILFGGGGVGPIRSLRSLLYR